MPSPFGEGEKRSFQRAPGRKSHSMPSQQDQLGMTVRPLHGEVWGSGSKGAIVSHCASVSSRVVRAAVTPAVRDLGEDLEQWT